MVEAAVVLPVLVIFLGLTAFKYTSYREKMNVQQGARRDALFYASHGCTGSGGTTSPTNSQVNPNGNASYQNAVDKGPPSAEGMQSATSHSQNIARSEQSVTARAGGRTRSLSGSAAVYCNERPVDGDPEGVITWSFSFFKSGLL